ncbi:MAG: amidohydrolase family protein [Methanoregula sp.]|jgi:cytosine/adenosine deaminase-related metal-dependent hydrolase
MKSPQVISGQALVGDEFSLEPVDIVVEAGMITGIEANPRAPPVWICPAFFNAHTHLGDTVAMDYPAQGSLEELVTPPDGIKHRLLARTPYQDLVAGMRAGIGDMIATGTRGCADFREGGINGVRALREASEGLGFRAEIFGRDGGEAEADGLGISSARDVPDVEEQVKQARNLGKKIAFHAGERDGGDIDAALAFDPDLLIHMTHATPHQIRECADRQIPVAICPRSNWLLGVTSSARHPPVARMIDCGCTLLLGTDNAMFVQPDMFAEMAFLHMVYHPEPRQVLRSAVMGSALIGTPVFIVKGARAAFFTLDPSPTALCFSHDPVTTVIKRAGTARIVNSVFNG